MSFLSEKKSLIKAASKILLKLSHANRIKLLKVSSATGEIDKFGVLTFRRDNEAARNGCNRNIIGPKRQRLSAKGRDDRLGALQFAPRRDHPASQARTTHPSLTLAIHEFDT